MVRRAGSANRQEKEKVDGFERVFGCPGVSKSKGTLGGTDFGSA